MKTWLYATILLLRLPLVPLVGTLKIRVMRAPTPPLPLGEGRGEGTNARPGPHYDPFPRPPQGHEEQTRETNRSRTTWKMPWLLANLCLALATPAVSAGTGRDLEVHWTSAGVRLAGSLRLPEGKGPFPAMLLVSGTQPDTRDSPTHGLPLFRRLAEALARTGVASLRYDDRGTGTSAGSGAWDYPLDTLRGDLRSALDLLGARPELDPRHLGLLGHSLGASLAVEVAAGDPRIAFVALLAPYGTSGGELLLDYRRRACLRLRLASNLCQGLLALDRRLLAGEALSPKDYPRSPLSQYDAFLVGFSRSVLFQGFVRDSPRPALMRLALPLWIGWGATDQTAPPRRQLPIILGALLGAGRDDADLEIRIFPGADHGFTLVDGNGRVRLARGLTRALSDWAAQVSREGPRDRESDLRLNAERASRPIPIR